MIDSTQSHKNSLLLNPKQARLYFIGIGGIGMSGIAAVLHNQGYTVSGSDLNDSENVKRLREMGISVHIGHDPKQIADKDVIVTSSAVKANNPEVMEAKRLRIPVIPRAEMLAEILRGKTGITVAGTHGKTTTTTLLATVLTEAALDPTVVIGGIVDSLGGNSKVGQSEYVVVEADESDGSFLHLPALYTIVTNIDDDHLDHFGNLATLKNTFVDFVGKLPFYGLALVCGEDSGVQSCLEKFTKPFLTYGFSKEWDVVASDIRENPNGFQFQVLYRGLGRKTHESLGSIVLHKPGRHNVLNALAVVGLTFSLGIPFETIARAMESFKGIRRRFEICWVSEDRNQMIVDDYGHHPTEIEATLQAARQLWKGRILVVFQPHRYSRTQQCFEGFTKCFKNADHLLVTDIYPGGEDPIQGVHSQRLVEVIQQEVGANKVEYVSTLDLVQKRLQQIFSSGDLIVCMGAGSITRLPKELTQLVQKAFA